MPTPAWKAPLVFACLAEAATGLALVAHPPLVVRLLFGVETAGVGVVVSRVAGIALIALGIACWPGNPGSRPHHGMLAYSALATLYLAWIGLAGDFAGSLLWPAVMLHVVLTAALARACLDTRP